MNEWIVVWSICMKHLLWVVTQWTTIWKYHLEIFWKNLLHFNTMPRCDFISKWKRMKDTPLKTRLKPSKKFLSFKKKSIHFPSNLFQKSDIKVSALFHQYGVDSVDFCNFMHWFNSWIAARHYKSMQRFKTLWFDKKSYRKSIIGQFQTQWYGGYCYFCFENGSGIHFESSQLLL